MKTSIHIIGSGFASVSAACYLAAKGFDVNVYEKNTQLGGRARQLERHGFKFDMGPTWYWMPDVFDRFFNDFGKKTSDYYQLERLDPAYRIYFGENDILNIDGELAGILKTFENIEPGAGKRLSNFIAKAKKNYEIAIKKLVYKPGLSPLELVNKDTVLELKQFIFTISDYVSKHFKDHRLQKALEFPVLFLGAKPSDTPLFYSFMNYADFGLGTWYPKGGMKSVIDGAIQLGKELGVKYHVNAAVSAINISSDRKAESIVVNDKIVPVTTLISGADYNHSESLLPSRYRSYDDKYWSKKVMAPSSLLFYVGFSKKLKNILHHTLFFDTDFNAHAKEIYDNPAWPKKPLFYASFPSVTDSDVAPVGMEAATFLIPLAPDLEDTNELREKYFQLIIERLEKLTEQKVSEHILFKESYCVKDFKDDYNSYKGNAYGLANTLRQTAFLRPKIQSKIVSNLFFTGQLTVPGPGVPPALISGKIVGEQIINSKSQKHETTI